MALRRESFLKALESAWQPFLNGQGFGDRVGATAWRERPSSIDVIAVEVLGRRLAESLGCAEGCFSVRAGIYYRAVHLVPWASGPAPSRPEEPACHARRTVRRRALFGLSFSRRDIWSVDEGGGLQTALESARDAVEAEALPWFEALGETGRALEVFEEKEETSQNGVMVEALSGAVGSVSRAEVASALALSLGDSQRAARAWYRVLDNPYYQRFLSELEKARSRISAIERRGIDA